MSGNDYVIDVAHVFKRESPSHMSDKNLFLKIIKVKELQKNGISVLDK